MASPSKNDKSIDKNPKPTGDGKTSSTPKIDADRIAARAELLPEEKRAGSDDPMAQAEAILVDAEERSIDAIENPLSAGERRTSAEAAD